MKIHALGIVSVLMGFSCVPLLAGDLFESPQAIDAFFYGSAPRPGVVLVRGRVLRPLPQGLLVKCVRTAADSAPGGIPRIYGVILLRDYPNAEALTPGDRIQVTAHLDGTDSHTDSSGTVRTVRAYAIDSIDSVAPADASDYSPNPAEQNPVEPDPAVIISLRQGSKPRSRSHSHQPKPDRPRTHDADTPGATHPDRHPQPLPEPARPHPQPQNPGPDHRHGDGAAGANRSHTPAPTRSGDGPRTDKPFPKP